MLGYTKLGKIGQGSYSQVYLCQKPNSPIYACKIMHKERNKETRYKNEVESLQRLRYCPMVTQYIDHFEDREHYYIVQEYCNGGSLKEGGYYGETHANNIIYNALCALEYVHAAGIVHRDIKVSNVFLHDHKIKLGDFGLAHMYHAPGLVHTQELVGTPMYMSPETIQRQCGPKTDVWSIGVLTYYLLTNLLPFTDEDSPWDPGFSNLAKAIQHQDPSFKNKLWSRISPEAIDFIRCCLAKNYEERYSVSQALRHRWFNPSTAKLETSTPNLYKSTI